MGFLRLSGAFHDSSILLAVDGGFIVFLLPDSFAIRTRLHGCMLSCFAWFTEFFILDLCGFVDLFLHGFGSCGPFCLRPHIV